jgi:hypothetical protein
MLPNFNNSQMRVSISHNGCYGGVVAARYDTCEEPLAFVNYSQVGNDFIIISFSVHPVASVKEAQLAGDLIDAALELEAMKHNVKQLLIVSPGKSTAEFVKEYQAKPFVIGCDVKANTAVYVN